MTIIKPILSYSKGICSGLKTSSAIETKECSKEEKASLTEPKRQVSADEVFKYMSASATQVKPTKTVTVSTYVNAESSDRISKSVNQFENMFNKTLDIIKNEFGDILSEDAMSTLTLQLLT